MSDSKIIRTKVRQLLPTLDLETATQRTIQQQLEAELGMELDEYKSAIKAEVDAYLTQAPGDEEDQLEAAPPPKKQKVQQQHTVGAHEGPPGFLFSLPISTKRFAGVRIFNKRGMVDVREFYDKDGQLAPGAKGLAMSPEQWAALTAALQPLTEALGRADETFCVELGGNERAGVSVFSGKVMLSLREFYEKDGKMLPGKKGITLPADQWAKLCAAHEELTQQLEAVAGPLPAPKPPKPTAAAGGAGTSAADAAAAGPPGCISLAPMRRAEVSKWKGKRMVSIREFYSAPDGELKHGKKGVQLPAEQFALLRQHADEITAALGAQDTAFGVQLAQKRKVTVSAFKGKFFVDIREYYEKDGQLTPGQRGIALPPDQWEKLCGGLEGLAADMEGAA